MAFDWSSTTPGPEPEELEISIFGPGYGECVVIHVGSGRWMIVDSCIDSSDRDDKRPVAEQYLRAINVNLEESVDLIVATHWHSDHIRGIGRLVELCRNSTFSCANSMLHEEFLVYVEEMATAASSTGGAKISDFRDAIRQVRSRNGAIRWATGGRLIHSWQSAANPEKPRCRVSALSPSDREFDLFLAEVNATRPLPTKPKKAAASRTPNLASIVLHVQHEIDSIVLGADMEAHHDPLRGWTAAIHEGQRGALPRGGLLKVPHHGSATGHHDGIWNNLLDSMPLAVITPFNRLPDSRKLPTFEDLARLTSLTRELYLTAPAHRSSPRRRAAAVERGLRESNISIRESAVPLGLVRSRKRVGHEWVTQLFHPATRIASGY